MKFTGERFIPTEQGRIRLEHYHRYALVAEIVGNKSVLDIACGEGYGSSFLADKAGSVVGVDISEEAIKHAAQKYKKSNLSFRRGSATTLDFPEASFDIVVSFETIEHLAEQNEMLAEIRRVLQPNGFLVISSPNRPIYSEESGEHNEFHVKELNFDEFDELLKTQFPVVQYHGQRMLMGSVIQSLKGGNSTYKVWQDEGANLIPHAGSLDDPVYFVAVASARKNQLPTIKPSVIYPNNLDLVRHYVGFAKWAKNLDILISERNKNIDLLNREIGFRDKEIVKLAQTINDHEQSITKSNQQILNLAQNVRERDQENEILAQRLLERDGEVRSLNQSITEREHQLTKRDEQIMGLGEVVVSSSQEISYLNKTISRHQLEIDALKRAILDRDQQLINRDLKISILNESIVTREEQIKNLGESISQNKEQIKTLSEDISQNREQIMFLKETNSDSRVEIENLRNTISDYMKEIHELTQGISDRELDITNLNETSRELAKQIVTLENEVVKRGEWGMGLDAELALERGKLRQAHARLNEIGEGWSWRLTMPLRETKRWFVTPREQSRKYSQKSLKFAKKIYQKLPLKVETIESHRKFLAKKATKLLRITDTRLDGGENTTLTILNADSFDPTSLVSFSESSNSIQDAKSLNLETSENPIISIIIPIYGKIDYTLECLASISNNFPGIPVEIIVVDDCSPDSSSEILANVQGIRLLRNAKNQGFIRSCNIGAKEAKGEYIHFLNNDTQVTSGWLDELHRTFEEFPGTGFVGSKLLYPDGRLQEAGGIIWQDGSAWNFGRFQDPQLPIYNYAREVDYCSGASIMLPKSLFDDLGGFDEHYLPAYCEDSDLALKIREKGHRVIYQPLSTVVHYEGITSGNDLNQGVKSYQVENTKKLYERWSRHLQSHQLSGVEVDSAKDRRATRRVLVLDSCTPTPDQDAGSITTFNLMLLLREMDFQVTFIPADNFLYMPEYTSLLQRLGVECLYAPYITNLEQHLSEQGERYDLVLIFRPGVAEKSVKLINKFASKAKILYHTVDLHFLRMFREADLANDKSGYEAATIMKQRELDVIASSDAAIVHSTAEYEILRPELPKSNLCVFPLILDIPGTSKSFAQRSDIVFIGGYQHPPNVDAVKYFVSEIMPILRRRLSGFRFFAVGSNPPPEIEALACEDVIITGFVKDLGSFLDNIRVSVAPLRYGAGIKGKIGTAMACGLPVVASNLAVEGMLLKNGDNIVVAESPKSFAKAIAKLYLDEKLWKRVSENGIKEAENAWGKSSASRILSDLLDKLGMAQNQNNKYQLSLYSENRCSTKNNKIAR